MSGAGRLAYVDWLRGLAVLLMIQTHVYDSWLSAEARRTPFFRWSQALGGAPAPLFLFLAGLALALLAERGRRGPQASPSTGPRVMEEGIRRGLEVLGYAVLFRLWMFTTGGFTRPADLLRVDVLNCMGLTMALMSVATFGWRAWGARIATAGVIAVVIAVLTPMAWDAGGLEWLPAPLGGYVSGRGPSSFFPLFPWAGFTAVGAATGLVLDRSRALSQEPLAVAALGAGGAMALCAAVGLDRFAPALHRPGDFWHTSPSYFLARVGILLLLVGVAWVWHRTPWSAWPSVLRQLGRTSLLVYWVHVELVYGVSARWIRRSLDPVQASWGLVALVVAMLALSLWRTEGWLARVSFRGAPVGAA